MAKTESSDMRSPAPATGSSGAAIQAVPVRHWGRWVGAVVVLVLVAWLIVSAAAAPAIQWEQIPAYILHPNILAGLRNTLVISVLAQGAGIVLGIGFAVMRLSGNPVMAAVASAYVWFFRGTPVLVQLLVWFNLGLVFATVTIAVPFTQVTVFSMPMNQFMTPFMAALLGLGLNEGAYMAEIVRGGIVAVDEGQGEAAAALGMTRGLAMRRIILPQAMRVIVPPTGNEFISMLKLSSLATVVTYGELLRRAQDLYTQNLLILELLFTISIWYLLVTTVASVGQYFLERRYARGTSRGARSADERAVLARLRALGRGGRGGRGGGGGSAST